MKQYDRTPAACLPVDPRVDAGAAPGDRQGTGAYARFKRLIDVCGASFFLVLFLPVFVLAYVAARSDGGPAFFNHARIGRNGRVFRCWKFRSMVVDADARLEQLLANDPEARQEWSETFKLRRDPRISRVGRFLRRSSLDELPQLYNVLRGDMSLVGPRPIVVSEVPRYKEHINAYYSVRPGVTGLWQVSGRNNVDYEQRVQFDANYVSNMCFTLDMLILARTVGVVVVRPNGY